MVSCWEGRKRYLVVHEGNWDSLSRYNYEVTASRLLKSEAEDLARNLKLSEK